MNESIERQENIIKNEETCAESLCKPQSSLRLGMLGTFQRFEVVI